mgnify:CR=1 FL=1
MELSTGQELELQGADLDDLASHADFKKDVLRSKRSPAQYLLRVARKYWITDLDWLRYVIKTWDGERPLPSPDNPEIKRSNNSRYDLWRGANGVFSVETCSYEATPRMLWRRSLVIDRLGSKWLVLRVRLFPGLRASSLESLAKESLTFAFHRPSANKKSTKKVIVRQYLDALPSTAKANTTYHLAKLLVKKFGVSMSSGKNYVTAWKKAHPSAD